ncbi:uncharacterized protein MONOS_5385 [Monocercomonoides exilis]|uniref:uncharacterized protein n=1 Tax=Monocercomonoides exilis TaxID=2049356 RepID=UPI0035594325|nr:hypothetical protein MONOS_5385 [Monocercomonoides exilis]|eukprot:MONOS_5385.1-p1 / transcript=MONOS_5385.1 / gene=MONOS_5385 / organism=Monocercomonoides_exilis_PA203 / gene_product=unspecified product / transcript_product=unspecified product / location=Mono_scaffold00156:3272-4003(-) / protein_length=201 / sequence_SO=supercontig / SO=protein_coding / is_pseudo=false
MSKDDGEDIYDYDSYLEKKETKQVKTIQGDAPKYLLKLIDTAKQRRAEQEEAAAKLAMKNSEEEKVEKEVQKFITPAYKAKLSSKLSQNELDNVVESEEFTNPIRIKVTEGKDILENGKDELRETKDEKSESVGSSKKKVDSKILAMKLKVFGDEGDEERKQRQLERERQFIEHSSKRRNDQASVEAARQRYFQRCQMSSG